MPASGLRNSCVIRLRSRLHAQCGDLLHGSAPPLPWICAATGDDSSNAVSNVTIRKAYTELHATAFLSSAAMFGLQPSPKRDRGGQNERLFFDIVHVCRTGRVSRVPVAGDRDDSKDSGRRQLLAMQGLRRSVEQGAIRHNRAGWPPSMATLSVPA